MHPSQTGTGTASRRFYRAFYRWSLLTGNAGPGPGSSPRCYAIHTSVRRSRNENGESTSSTHSEEPQLYRRRVTPSRVSNHPNLPKTDAEAQIRPQYHTRSLKPHIGEDGQTELRDIYSEQDGDAGDSISVREQSIMKDKKEGPAPGTQEWRSRYGANCPTRWVKGPVSSAIETPFDTLRTGKDFLRYRSEFGVMVEMAVRSDGLDELRRTYGPNLQHLSEKYGARIEVQNLSSPVPPKDVGGLEGLRNYSVLISGTFADVSEVWPRLKSVKLIRPSPEDQRPAGKPPSDTMKPFESIVRRKSSDAMVLELSVPETFYTKLVANVDISAIESKHSVKIDVGGPEQRPSSGQTTEKETARSFNISGDPDSVDSAKKAIRTTIKHQLDALEYFKQVPTEAIQSKDVSKDVRDSRERKTSSKKDTTTELPKATAVDTPRQSETTMERIIITSEGPNQKEVMIDFIGNGLKLETLKNDLGLEMLRPTKHHSRAALLVESPPSGLERIRAKVLEHVETLCNKKGYKRHIIRSYNAPLLNLPPSHQSSNEDKMSLSNDLRTVIRTLRHPVLLITAVYPFNDKGPWRTSSRGLTVSSLNTVTLNPDPIISFNVKLPSSTWDAMYATRRLRVTFLSATPRGAAIAHTFTRPYKNPVEPFDKLNAMGVYMMRGTNMQPPWIRDYYGGTMGNIEALVLPDRCVLVGDHVIVVAQVIKKADIPEKGLVDVALSYSMQRYQGATGPIEPDESSMPKETPGNHVATESSEKSSEANGLSRLKETPENHTTTESSKKSREELDGEIDPFELFSLDHAETSEVGKDQQPSSQTPEKWPSREFSDGSSSIPFSDPLYDVLRATSEGEDLQLKGMADDKDLETDDDFVDYDDEGRDKRKSRRRHKKRDSGEEFPFDEEDYDFRFDRPPQAPNAPSGTFESPKRFYSTSARLLPFNTKRFYSSSASSARDLSTLVNPSTAHTTVSDYLCIPDDRRPYTPRVRGLVYRQPSIIAARERLATESSDLFESEISELKEFITTHENIAIKRLAWNAAVDLRFMLDKGRYDEWFFEHVGWFESCVEKGESLLLKEIGIVDKMWEEGKLGNDEGKYRKIKKHLEEKFEVFRTETRRLARVMEETGDDD